MVLKFKIQKLFAAEIPFYFTILRDPVDVFIMAWDYTNASQLFLNCTGSPHFTRFRFTRFTLYTVSIFFQKKITLHDPLSMHDLNSHIFFSSFHQNVILPAVNNIFSTVLIFS